MPLSRSRLATQLYPLCSVSHTTPEGGIFVPGLASPGLASHHVVAQRTMGLSAGCGQCSSGQCRPPWGAKTLVCLLYLQALSWHFHCQPAVLRL